MSPTAKEVFEADNRRRTICCITLASVSLVLAVAAYYFTGKKQQEWKHYRAFRNAAIAWIIFSILWLGIGVVLIRTPYKSDPENEKLYDDITSLSDKITAYSQQPATAASSE